MGLGIDQVREKIILLISMTITLVHHFIVVVYSIIILKRWCAQSLEAWTNHERIETLQVLHTPKGWSLLPARSLEYEWRRGTGSTKLTTR